MAGLLTPGPTLAKADELRAQRGSRGLLEALGGPMSYAPNPVVAALGQGLLGARYLTGEKEMGEGLASLSDMTAMMVGSRVPAALRNIVIRGYHGTPSQEPIDKFKTDGHSAQRVAGGYFSKNPKNASSYTKVNGEQRGAVYPVLLDIKKPADRAVLDELGYKLDGEQMRKELIRRGYDGVVDDFMDEVVVFSPSQVRSVFGK